MLEKENNPAETETALTLEILLMNILVLDIGDWIGWLTHFALTEDSSLNVIMRGSFLRG